MVHSQELTYSVAAPVAAPPMQIYAAICDGLVAALSLLGVDARRVRPQLTSRPAGVARNACFASFSRQEVEVGGRKLVGSAQRRKRRAFLQQGSLPLTDPVPLMCDLLTGGGEPAFGAALRERLTWLGEHVPSLPPWRDLAEVVVEGFRASWGVTVRRGAVSDWEARRTAQLSATRTVKL